MSQDPQGLKSELPKQDTPAPFEHPKDHEMPANWKGKDWPTWPLWVILGAAGMGVIWLVTSKLAEPKYAQAPQGPLQALTTPPGPDVPPDPTTLFVNGIYKIDAPTPLFDSAGGRRE
jgi:hypothetical protein